MLDEIRKKLTELQAADPARYGAKTIYGRASLTEVPTEWNYITFNRSLIKKSGTSQMDYNEYFQVNLVHEDYVPEGVVYEVINKLSELNGLKLAADDVEFNYLLKNGVDTVVEVATITFTRPVKGWRRR